MSARGGAPSPDGNGQSPPGDRTASVSVVVASHCERALLDACLASLLPQCREEGAEIVVARPEDRGDLEELRSEYPSVRLQPAPAGSEVPVLRGVGLGAAGGRTVALTEDHCVAGRGWLSALLEGRDGAAEVVGGPMDNARRDRIRDWAAFFAEYGFFATEDGPDGPAVTGANVCYRRSILDRVTREALAGEWENVIHERLEASGCKIRFAPDAIVYHNRSWGAREFCVDRFRHGRDYARARLREMGPTRRWIHLTGTPLLPLLLALRIARGLPSRHALPFLEALPMTLLYLAAWSVGEAIGYAEGPPPEEPRDGA